MTKFSFEQTGLLRMLTALQIETIHENALYLLENMGARFQHKKALQQLAEKGCIIDEDTQIVRFPRDLVIQAITAAPERFDMYNCKGERTMQLGCGNHYFGAGPGATKITDKNGIRSGKIIDFEEALSIAENSKNLDIATGSIIPGDVPVSIADLYILYKAIKESDKTILAESWENGSENRIGKLIDTVSGSKEAFAEKPFLMLSACPSPPLKWDEHVIDNAYMCMEYGVPAFVNASPVMGVSAPVTFAGAVLLHTVENLSFITFMQLMKPGTPVFYGGICATMDMRTTYSSQSAGEACICTAGYAAMAKYYSIPSLAFLAQTDAKVPDYQAGFETGVGALVSVLSGIDVIYGAGTLDSYLSTSNEKLAIDSELLGYIKMIGRGIQVDEETLAVKEIEAVGCGDKENYLQREHTVKWFRSQQYMGGSIIDRESYINWQNNGKDIIARAEDTIRQSKENKKTSYDENLIAKADKAMQEIAMEMNVELKEVNAPQE